MSGKMNKKIVLFGTDNSGKSTLGVDLAKDLGGFYLPPLGPKPLMNQLDYLKSNLGEEGVVIFDRFPVIEEEVCGPIFRGTSNFSRISYTEYLSQVDLFVFCNPGLQAILNWGERRQMSGVKENILDLYSGYCKWFKKLRDEGYKVVEYNWQIPDNYEKLLKGVTR